MCGFLMNTQKPTWEANSLSPSGATLKGLNSLSSKFLSSSTFESLTSRKALEPSAKTLLSNVLFFKLSPSADMLEASDGHGSVLCSSIIQTDGEQSGDEMEIMPVRSMGIEDSNAVGKEACT
ncbi:hypothetical protein Ccrd_015481 [Cynara cardunculus var. scolymus]|uniref:Uncharacterized protein n=1 Tax=Cynara cardunculus var. scolymus TaxID=59895 RepID=A0A103YBU0_CYNCS|nr:hypothetical protein Ccrd_015481 [Cynara cardunculus var. scolymus]